MPTAFKEWAVTVRALAEGEQLITLRKSGLRDERRRFEPRHDRFFLYPTFESYAPPTSRSSGAPSRRACGLMASPPCTP